jgi:WD40 repeat protein
VATAGTERSIFLWETSTGKKLSALQESAGRVMDLAFTGDGKTVVSGHWDRSLGPGGFNYSIRSCDVSTGKELKKFPVQGLSGSPGIVFSPGAATVAFGHQDGTIFLWDVASGKETHRLRGPDAIVSRITFTVDGNGLAALFGETRLGVADLQVKKEMRLIDMDTRFNTSSFALSPDGGRFAASVLDKPAIYVWDAATGKKLHTLEGHKGAVKSLAFSADGKLLVSGGEDHSVRLWDLESGMERRRLNGHRGNIYVVRFSPDGKLLVTGSKDTTLLFWDLSVVNKKE